MRTKPDIDRTNGFIRRAEATPAAWRCSRDPAQLHILVAPGPRLPITTFHGFTCPSPTGRTGVGGESVALRFHATVREVAHIDSQGPVVVSPIWIELNSFSHAAKSFSLLSPQAPTVNSATIASIVRLIWRIVFLPPAPHWPFLLGSSFGLAQENSQCAKVAICWVFFNPRSIDCWPMKAVPKVG